MAGTEQGIMTKNEERFYRFCLYTIVCVTLLFFLGGLVRSTGSGMGCPDWPLCFGKIIPPMNADQLPADYKETFLEKRKSKIERFIKLLERNGMHKEAEKIKQSPALLVAHDFNTATAYTEYINRLFGVLTGFFMLLTLFFSLKMPGSKYFVLWSMLALVMIVFNGWLGSIVVDSNLFPGLVSVHFIFAFAAIVFLMLAWHHGKGYSIQTKMLASYRYLFVFVFLASFIQIFSGINVRTLVETRFPDEMISLDAFLNLGNGFDFHRYFPGIILVVLSYFLLKGKLQKEHNRLYQLLWVLWVIALLQISTGAMNIVMHLPTFAQVGHITLGSLLFVMSLEALIRSFRTQHI